MMVMYAAKVLTRRRYDSAKIIKNNPLALQDLAFNAIAVRANAQLQIIAKLGETIPEHLAICIKLHMRLKVCGMLTTNSTTREFCKMANPYAGSPLPIF